MRAHLTSPMLCVCVVVVVSSFFFLVNACCVVVVVVVAIGRWLAFSFVLGPYCQKWSRYKIWFEFY